MHKGGVIAAVAANVSLAAPGVDNAKAEREIPRICWLRPGRALGGPKVTAVRPAEEHAEVHARHEALAATVELPAGVLGAAAATFFVRKDDGNSTQWKIVTEAVVFIPRRAVV